jgi:hypothetical protein
VTEQERETAGAVRSAHVAHFFSPDWAQTAQRAMGALERTSRDVAATQVLVLAPDAAAAVAVARELRLLAPASGLRILPVTSAARAGRLVKEAPAHVVVGAPATLAELLVGSLLKLDQVHTALLASADEFDTQMEPLGALMAELPRGSARILTAAEPNALVENILERYLHRARRVVAPSAEPVPVAPGTPATIYVRIVGALAPFAPLGELLDELDPPSTAIVVQDSRAEGQAHSALEALGYSADSALVTVTRGHVTLHTALVLFVGLPEPTALTAALGAHPARLVALITARQRRALERLTRGTVLMPYERSRAARAAKVREDAMRGELRSTLLAGQVSREILAVEPLLAEYDGLEIAGAALKLWERAQAEATVAKLLGREEVRQEMKAARAEREPVAESRPPRERSFERSPRGERSRHADGPRSDRPPRAEGPRADRPPRTEGPRGERSFGGPPRGDRPFVKGPRSDKPRSDRPFTRGPKRDDKGRPPRREK